MPITLRAVAGVLLILSGCGRDDGSVASSPPTLPSGARAGAQLAPRGTELAEEYVHDGAGNLTGIGTAGPGVPLAITGFAPGQGTAGQRVTVSGAGFSAAAGGNVVSLGGSPATVVHASATRLDIVVPEGAATGRITVTTGGSTVASASDYVIEARAVISSFSPTQGKAGTQLTILGTGFDPDPARNAVRVGAGTAEVTAASSESLTVLIAAGATSGKISVTTPYSTAVSAGDFSLIPDTVSESNVASTERLGYGTPVTIPIPSAGKTSMLFFDGQRGRSISLFVKDVTQAEWTLLTVLDPAGASLATSNVRAGQTFKITVPRLRTTGIYTILVQPTGASGGAFGLTLFEDVEVELDPRGPAVAMALQPGQNGRCNFEGRPGDYLGFAYPSLTTTPSGAWVQMVLENDDGVVAGGNLSVPRAGSWQMMDLDLPRRYTMAIRPEGNAGASATFLLSRAIQGRLEADGAPVRYQTARPGQAGRYVFDGIEGRSYSLRATTGSTFASDAKLSFLRPDGTSFFSRQVPSGRDTRIDLEPLEVTGKHTVTVTPLGLDTGVVTLELLTEDSGDLPVDGPPRSVELRAGRSGRYTFEASAGDSLNVVVANLPAGGFVMLDCFRPNGAILQGTAATAATTWWLPQIPTSGTYTVTVRPPASSTSTLTATTLTLQVRRR